MAENIEIVRLDHLRQLANYEHEKNKPRTFKVFNLLPENDEPAGKEWIKENQPSHIPSWVKSIELSAKIEKGLAKDCWKFEVSNPQTCTNRCSNVLWAMFGQDLYFTPVYYVKFVFNIAENQFYFLVYSPPDSFHYHPFSLHRGIRNYGTLKPLEYYENYKSSKTIQYYSQVKGRRWTVVDLKHEIIDSDKLDYKIVCKPCRFWDRRYPNPRRNKQKLENLKVEGENKKCDDPNAKESGPSTSKREDILTAEESDLSTTEDSDDDTADDMSDTQSTKESD